MSDAPAGFGALRAPSHGVPVERVVPTFLSQVYEVARKEFLQHVRTKRLLIIGPIFLLALVFMTIIVPLAFLGERNLDALADALDVSLQNGVMLFFLTGFFFLSGYFYIQLVPILLTADAVCSEWSNRTIFLLLSKPVSRTAFVLGKWAGSVFTVVVTLGSLLLLDYILLQLLLPGGSDAGDWGRFFGALLILTLGAMAYASMSLMWGTVTRSTVVANILAITSWMIILPLLSNVGFIVEVAKDGIDNASLQDGEWSKYLSPGSSMAVASDVLSPVPDGADLGGIMSLFGVESGLNVWGAVIALLLQTAVFLGISILVVQRRDFE